MKESPRERRGEGKVMMKVFMNLTARERRGEERSRHGKSGGGRLDGC